jgi:hypothetical protein
MSARDNLGFGFEGFGQDRAALLDEAAETISALKGHLGPEAVPAKGDQYALDVLDRIRRETARFAAFPDVLPFGESGFTEHALTVPHGFSDLQERYRFFWVRFPLVLIPAEDFAFTKLECRVEFNPGVTDGRLRPKALLILPDRRFRDVAKGSARVALNVGGNVDLAATTPRLNLQYGVAKAEAGAGFDVGADAGVDVELGPFEFRMRLAEVEHNAPGAEEVFWRLTGTRFTEEDDPTFIVVLQVPKEVDTVQVAAAMQAYHSRQFGLPILNAIPYFGERLAAFFQAGAPLSIIKSWDNILPVAT